MSVTAKATDLAISGLTKAFGTSLAVDGLTLRIAAGELVALLGPSGCGKTTTLRMIAGLIEPTAGDVLIGGFRVTHVPVHRRNIGMLFQGSALFDSMTVEQNIMFPLDMFTTDDFSTKLKRVNEVLERVNMKDVNKKFPAEISGGMKKRVGIARAIVLNPKYLFCDEPNSGLDPLTSILIDKLIKEITTEYNITTVVNTHDMNSVMETGDHIIYMYDGLKEWEGSNKEIIFSKNKKLNDFIFASEFLQDAKDMRMLEMKGKIDNNRNMDELLK